MNRFEVLPVTWHVGAYGDWEGALTRENARSAMEWALAEWSAVCRISFRYVESTNAFLVVACGAVDGRGGVYAHSQFAGGVKGDKVRIRLDMAEWWCFQEDPPAGYVDLGRVLMHEIGHAIGIREHGPGGGAMASTYEQATRKLDAWSVARAVELYGEFKDVEADAR